MPENSPIALPVIDKERIEFAFGSKQLTIKITRKERKTLGLRVFPNGRVEALVPPGINDDELDRQLQRKAPWIAKQLRFFESFHPLTPPRRYVNGETHRYLGRQYRLRICPDAAPAVRLQGGWIYVSMPFFDSALCEKLLATWYRERAKIYFANVLAEWLPRFRAFGLPIPTIRLRKMPTRWGSCTAQGVIYLHPDLIKAPGSSIAYVLVHELCHIVHHRHDREFYNLLSRILPDWEKRKDRLERIMV